MLITLEIQQKLLEKGVALSWNRPFVLPDNCVFEPPCNLYRSQIAHSLEIGAFSTTQGGYFFATKIGRYCSIEDNVQIGRGSHPISWGSTSPTLYQNHSYVFNQEIREAKNFLTNAKPRSFRTTVIGNDVHIGWGALINQGVHIGNGSIIKPMSVVTKDVPPYSVIEGNPGQIVDVRLPIELSSELNKLAWWKFAFWDLSEIPNENPREFLRYIEEKLEKGSAVYSPGPVFLKSLSNG